MYTHIYICIDRERDILKYIYIYNFIYTCSCSRCQETTENICIGNSDTWRMYLSLYIYIFILYIYIYICMFMCAHVCTQFHIGNGHRLYKIGVLIYIYRERDTQICKNIFQTNRETCTAGKRSQTVSNGAHTQAAPP